MSALGKDPDSNMQVANLENLPFYMEDVNIKPVIPLPTTIGDSWENIRQSPVAPTLHSSHAIPIDLLQLAKDHVDWPNKYMIQLSPTDALQPPSFDNRLRGVFYGTEGRKSAYVCNLMPIFKAEELHLVGRFLKLKAHLPACGPINPKDNSEENLTKYALKIDQGYRSNPRWTEINCMPIKHNGEKVNSILTYNGDLTLFITSIPTREVPMKLWKSPNNKHLQGMVCGHPVKLKLLSACQTCGSEDHDVAHCLYTNHLLGAPAIPEESDNEIMEISNIPEPISKKKKKAYKPASEVSTIKQRGNGCPVASSSLE
ncbi:uncharacterized protein PGTG_12027 [Puccinia graminis f. sp. tritici CRL 75-36-700-3]|uniref:Uncharacterized protein n=1 Tax=Puccinia graminis f. sp. tritici (strain CRL 75-36-700-3 / race SCCL) TaxID=418459 RepID=E3KP46_PUCGT|nr:uncharacterized protein PGTG_12027 [Puccinia graminis f. sp. tritici CRL 75-36-700-3]EFP86071.2 hypothetical protein PGTG_12027 [Puccinia graminis f. sp. tritici CRL 75-36-700-3]